MKNRVIPTLLVITFLLMLLLLTCANPSKQNSDVEKATEVYVIMAEKAITQQGDFDIEAWSDMLSEDIEYTFPDTGVCHQTTLVGKSAVINYWRYWRESHHIKTCVFWGFTHAPFVSPQKLKVSNLAGVYVFSIFISNMVFRDGKTVELFMNYCSHFNKDKLIDRCYTYYDRMPITQAIIHHSSNLSGFDYYINSF